MARPRYAAVDTKFLLALHQGDELYTGLIDTLCGMGFYFLATETVLQELSEMEDRGSQPDVRAAAHETLACLNHYLILTPELSAVQRGIAEIVAGKLLEREILPNGSKDDALVVAEAASHNCHFFITSRAEILSADRDALNVFLLRSDVSDLCPIDPEQLKRILDKLAPQEKSAGGIVQQAAVVE